MKKRKLGSGREEETTMRIHAALAISLHGAFASLALCAKENRLGWVVSLLPTIHEVT